MIVKDAFLKAGDGCGVYLWIVLHDAKSLFFAILMAIASVLCVIAVYLVLDRLVFDHDDPLYQTNRSGATQRSK